MASHRLPAIGRQRDWIEAEAAANSKWNERCANCGATLLEEKTAWVRKTATGPDDQPDEIGYCAECIQVDTLRSSRGQLPPAMESDSGSS
jgi:hypothetical protein